MGLRTQDSYLTTEVPLIEVSFDYLDGGLVSMRLSAGFYRFEGNILSMFTPGTMSWTLSTITLCLIQLLYSARG